MGSSPSKVAFPMPKPYEPPPRSTKWSFSDSIKKLGKKGKDREKYDDFIFPKFPTTTAAGMYGFPYYPQVPSAYPTYYAPMQMAIVQPIGVQQPVLAMPPTYVPIAPYQPAPAAVQPAIVPASVAQHPPAAQMPVPAIQSAPVQMPVPATAPTPAPVPIPAPVIPPSSSGPPPSQMPQPHPALGPLSQMPQPHPAHGPPSQMPQPHPAHGPPSQMPQPHSSHGSARARSPTIPNPVIPPPPIMGTAASDSGRLRLNDFYRTPDPPSQVPRSVVDDPIRLPTAAPPGRTPFAPPMQMPTPGPGPIPISNNPLPQLPADVWDTSPYREILEKLPDELPIIIDPSHRSDVFVDEPEPILRPPSRLAGLFGGRDKGKKPLRGLFRSRSSSVHDMPIPMPGEGSSSRHGHTRARTVTSIVVPPPGAVPMDMPEPGVPHTSMPIPSYGPPIRFDHTGDYAGFVNHSPHRVMYKNKMYPTALHLLEAMKFTHQPHLQERIRSCKDVNDMYPLSASFQEHVRPDWGQVFMKIMEDVLYLKFKQHPTLRSLLLRTGLADIIYADENSYWGEGLSGDGTNELGKALTRIRERLRQEVDP